MRVLIATVAVATLFWIPAAAEEPKQDEVQAELKKWQGLWQTSPGGMQHRDGKQVVANPVLDGPCFFVCGDRLIWLDEGELTVIEGSITDRAAVRRDRRTSRRLTSCSDDAMMMASPAISIV